MSDTPTVGRIVQYRQARGSQAWLPAIVTVTAETFVAGVWTSSPVSEPRFQTNEVYGHQTIEVYGRWTTLPARTAHIVDRDGKTYVDRDGETYRPAVIPPVKEGRVHLRVLSPTCADYPEWNVAEGEEPGCWRWPPRA